MTTLSMSAPFYLIKNGDSRPAITIYNIVAAVPKILANDHFLGQHLLIDDIDDVHHVEGS